MMKLWNKTFGWDFGATILTWRYRDSSRFYWKILSWLLGGFVFGILTSILFLAVGKPEWSLGAARLVFFAVFIAGVLSNLFRAILHGYEFKITEKAIVHAYPFFGWEKIGHLLGSADKPFRQTNFYLPWQDVQDIREQPESVMLVLKNSNEVEVPVNHVIKLTMNLNLNKPEPKGKGASKSEKLAYDKAVLRIVLQAAREARRESANAAK